VKALPRDGFVDHYVNICVIIGKKSCMATPSSMAPAAKAMTARGGGLFARRTGIAVRLKEHDAHDKAGALVAIDEWMAGDDCGHLERGLIERRQGAALGS
jgi:hypothetical protein